MPPHSPARLRRSAQSAGRGPGAHHPWFRRASGAHRIDGVGEPIALALHPLLAGNLAFAGGIAHSAAKEAEGLQQDSRARAVFYVIIDVLQYFFYEADNLVRLIECGPNASLRSQGAL